MVEDSGDIALGSGMRINLLSDLDVAYWCRVLDVDHCELRQAVQRVGPRAEAVIRHFESRRAGASREAADGSRVE